MTVGELIHSLSKQAVLDTLAHLYTGKGEWPEGYASLWEELRKMQPVLTDCSVVLSRTWSSDDEPEPLVDVSGRMKGDTQLYAIEFVPWQEWLSMPIEVDAELQPMPLEEQLAHCFYEMTWAGYTQSEVGDRLEEITDRVEEVKEAWEKEPKH